MTLCSMVFRELGYPFRWRTPAILWLQKAHFMFVKRKQRFTTRYAGGTEARRGMRTENGSACASKTQVLNEFLIGQKLSRNWSGSYPGSGPMRNSFNLFSGARKRQGRVSSSPCKLLRGSSFSSGAGGESPSLQVVVTPVRKIPQFANFACFVVVSF